MKTHCVIVPWLLVLTVVPCAAAEPAAWFQAHRGALDERPENTLPAIEHAWGLPGAVPEVDLRTTKDGVIVCIHDKTPARTTDAPETWAGKPIAEIPYDVLATWDAGAWFDPQYAGTRVPTLDAVFDHMARDDARQLYLDLKAVALDDVITKIKARGFEERIIFVHGNIARCAALQRACDGVRTMTWLSGPPDRIRARFKWLARRAFPGIDQVQLHLEATAQQPEIRYALEAAELADAVAKTRTAGVALQVRPFAFDAASLRGLLDLGIRWYVADAPAAFHAALDAAAGMTRENKQARPVDAPNRPLAAGTPTLRSASVPACIVSVSEGRRGRLRYPSKAGGDACATHRRQAGTPGLPSQKQLRANRVKRRCFCTSVSVL